MHGTRLTGRVPMVPGSLLTGFEGRRTFHDRVLANLTRY